MHELRAIRVPSRNETSKAAKNLRATEHTYSMSLRAARVGQQRLLGKGRHETKALSHTHKHTHTTHTLIDLCTQLQSATRKHRHSHAHTFPRRYHAYTHAQTMHTGCRSTTSHNPAPGCSGDHESIRLDILIKIFFLRAQTKKELCILLKIFFVRAQAYIEILHSLARRLVDSTQVGFVSLTPIAELLF
jgi:hypothetical protein